MNSTDVVHVYYIGGTRNGSTELLERRLVAKQALILDNQSGEAWQHVGSVANYQGIEHYIFELVPASQ